MANEVNIQLIQFFPLQKIEITESTKTYKPGSCGYVCYATPAVGLVKPLYVLFLRYGRKGKTRAMTSTVFHRCLDLSAVDEKYAKVLRKGEETNYQITAALTHADMGSKNVCEMPLDEFLCYIAAFSFYLCHLDVISKKPLNFIINGLRYEYGNILEVIDRFQDMHALQLAGVITAASTIGKVDGRDLLTDIKRFYEQRHRRESIMEILYKELSVRKQAVSRYHEQIIRSLIASRDTALKLLQDAQKENRKAAENLNNDNLRA